ncbi:gp15 [Listeria phage A511]|uniref:Gp15 n=1 Tax=Listeria phage A511 TaxID=2908169 RepID=A8AT39_BPA51|nr:gp15 [Listeria phage A511]AAY52986.1 gp15 [Listeria phage A511]
MNNCESILGLGSTHKMVIAQELVNFLYKENRDTTTLGEMGENELFTLNFLLDNKVEFSRKETYYGTTFYRGYTITINVRDFVLVAISRDITSVDKDKDEDTLEAVNWLEVECCDILYKFLSTKLTAENGSNSLSDTLKISRSCEEKAKGLEITITKTKVFNKLGGE